MKILTTFSGKFGDILWSLPTVREISRDWGYQVDMGIMPAYESLLPLLKIQSYIKNAFVIPDWICIGSPHGDQPWCPPETCEKGYDKAYHLTYQRHPSVNEPLMDFIALQQMLALKEPVIPFLECGMNNMELKIHYSNNWIAYAFNDMYADLKNRYLEALKFGLPNMKFVNVLGLDWLNAAMTIKFATAFVGCRSSNYVLAHGVGQKNIIVYEPHPNRNPFGPFGKTFGNAHWAELAGPQGLTPEQEAEWVLPILTQLVKEREDEYARTELARIN